MADSNKTNIAHYVNEYLPTALPNIMKTGIDKLDINNKPEDLKNNFFNWQNN